MPNEDSLDELIFLDNGELISSLAGASEMANREFAHELADQIIVISMLRSAVGDMTHSEAAEIAYAYHQVDKHYG
jgi:hypothetical protein